MAKKKPKPKPRYAVGFASDPTVVYGIVTNCYLLTFSSVEAATKGSVLRQIGANAIVYELVPVKRCKVKA